MFGGGVKAGPFNDADNAGELMILMKYLTYREEVCIRDGVSDMIFHIMSTLPSEQRLLSYCIIHREVIG